MSPRSHSAGPARGTPVISVVMPSYNHAPFVEAAVQSVLAQSFSDFELIIVDDGSTDGSWSILQRFDDPRISLHLQRNAGPSAALNAGIARARGEFIALMSSDDICHPHRLKTQLEVMRAEPVDALFSLPRVIDEAGRGRDDEDFPVFFERTFASSAELFRRLFHQGNFLCAPSAFLRADALRAVGGFRRGSIQLQDFELWARMCPRFQFRLLGERLIQYRVRGDESLSSPKRAVRTRFELATIYRGFLDNVPAAFLREAFPDVVGVDVSASAEDVELDKSFIFLSHTDPLVRGIGAERLFSQLDDERLAAKLREERGFGPRDLFRVTDTLDIHNLEALSALRTECSRLRRKPPPCS